MEQSFLLARMRQFAPLLLVLTGAVVAIAAYLHALDYPFVSDDTTYIVQNTKLAELQLAELWRLFIEPYNDYSEFLPLRDLSYWFDMALFGQNPAAFRIHNIILYLLSLPLIYAATLGIWRYFRPADAASAPWAAAAVTALFAVHPALAESVVWISGRKYMLPNVFSMLALWLAVKAKREHGLSPVCATATLAAFAATMLSKTSYITVAPVIALLWFFFWRDIPAPERRRSLLLWPLAILLLAAGMVTVFIASSSISTSKGEVPFYFGIEVVTRTLAVLGWLTRLAISPENRLFYYPLFEDPWLPAMTALGVAVLAIAAWGAAMLLRKRSLEGFALTAFMLLCIPYLQLVPYAPPSFVTNRFLSLAIWPFLLLIVALAWRLKPALRAAVLLAIALPLTLQTIERPQDWRSLEVLLDADIRAYPEYYLPAYHKIVVLQSRRGSYKEAFEIANNMADPEIRDIMIRLLQAEADVADALSTGDPHIAMIRLLNLGYSLKHPPDQCKWNFPMLLVWKRIKENYVYQWNSLAGRFADNLTARYKSSLWLLNDSDYEKVAVMHFRAIVESGRLPESMRGAAYMNLGLALLKSGHAAEAESPLRMALAQPRPDTRAHCVLAEVYAQTGRPDEATHAATDCRNRVPTMQSATNAYEEGNYRDALKEYRVLADRGDAAAQTLLGVMHDNGEGVPQDYVQAVAWYGKASEQGNADAQYDLGMMYGNGLGVPKDWVQAHKWFSLSALAGKENAMSTIKEAEANMTPAQIMEAKMLAREWQAKHR